MLRETGTYHVVRIDPTDHHKITGLFWTYPWCIEMWRKYPFVLQLDNTYKTNRFSMPLFQATGVTKVTTTFNAAFGLVDNEREDGFGWLAQQLLACQLHYGIESSGVVITDFDKALKNALKDHLPDAHQQICVFHINKNVVLNIKRKWKKTDDENQQPLAPNIADEAFADPILLEEADKHQLRQLNAPLADGEDLGAIRLPSEGEVAHSNSFATTHRERPTCAYPMFLLSTQSLACPSQGSLPIHPKPCCPSQGLLSVPKPAVHPKGN